MNPVLLFVGLLVLAYLGSILVGGRAIRGYGLPSGAEYVLLGLLLGPHVLGVLTRDTLTAFQPLSLVAIGWLALVVGLDYGFVGDRRLRPRVVIGTIGVTLLSAAITAAAAWFAARRWLGLGGAELWQFAAAAAVVTCETTRHAARWVSERYGAAGPLTNLMADLGDADDLVPLVLLAALFAVVAAPNLSYPLPWPAWAAITLALGAVLGGACAALLGQTLRSGEVWALLLGAALLGMGLATRLRFSGMSVLFALGLVLALSSPHRAVLRRMLVTTERPVLLPALVLAGAHVQLEASLEWALVIGALLVTRLGCKALRAGLLATGSPAARRGGPLMALSLMPAGALTLSMGLAFALAFPGKMGSLVLAIAVATALLGEIVGPGALRRALSRAGEIAPAGSAEIAPPPAETAPSSEVVAS